MKSFFEICPLFYSIAGIVVLVYDAFICVIRFSFVLSLMIGNLYFRETIWATDMPYYILHWKFELYMSIDGALTGPNPLDSRSSSVLNSLLNFC